MNNIRICTAVWLLMVMCVGCADTTLLPVNPPPAKPTLVGSWRLRETRLNGTATEDAGSLRLFPGGAFSRVSLYSPRVTGTWSSDTVTKVLRLSGDNGTEDTLRITSLTSNLLELTHTNNNTTFFYEPGDDALLRLTYETRGAQAFPAGARVALLWQTESEQYPWIVWGGGSLAADGRTGSLVMEDFPSLALRHNLPEIASSAAIAHVIVHNGSLTDGTVIQSLSELEGVMIGHADDRFIVYVDGVPQNFLSAPNIIWPAHFEIGYSMARGKYPTVGTARGGFGPINSTVLPLLAQTTPTLYRYPAWR